MNKLGWLATILLGMLAASVALAFAGWEPIAIVGLLTALASVAAPVFALITKTDELGRQTTEVHEIVNSQRTADTAYRQRLAKSLRDHDIVVPLDATGRTD